MLENGVGSCVEVCDCVVWGKLRVTVACTNGYVEKGFVVWGMLWAWLRGCEHIMKRDKCA